MVLVVVHGVDFEGYIESKIGQVLVLDRFVKVRGMALLRPKGIAKRPVCSTHSDTNFAKETHSETLT